MKSGSLILILLSAMVCSAPARADNKAVESAIRSRPELSTFYEALATTGVLKELKANGDYTVFAPTNDAFVAIDVNEYPCFYSMQCRTEVAAILRDHIIDDHYTIDELVKRGGNPASTLGKHDLYVEEPFKGHYEAEGQSVSNGIETAGSIVFPVGGVIIHDRDDLDRFKTLKTAAPGGSPAAHPVPGGGPGETMPAAAPAASD